MRINDVIYEQIHINDPMFIKLINTKAIQRLKRIKQQEHTYILNKHAIQNRFEHTIGVYHMTEKILKVNKIDGFEKRIALVTSLLHDVGHGPFSHTFEGVTGVHHEKWSEKIIKNDPEINSILNSKKNLMDNVLNVLNRKGKFILIEQIIFSELGADKLDYIQRDYFYNFKNNPLNDKINLLITKVDYSNSKNVFITKDILNDVMIYYKMKEKLFVSGFGHEIILGFDLMLKVLLNESKQEEIKKLSILSEDTDHLYFYLNLVDENIKNIIINEFYYDEIIQKIQYHYTNKLPLNYEIESSKFENLINHSKFSEIVSRPLKYGSYSNGIHVLTDSGSLDLNEYIKFDTKNKEILFYL